MFNPKLYPPNWREFSRHIRQDRAKGGCECTGECGLHLTTPGPRRCIEKHGTKAMFSAGRIILTTAHLCGCNPLCAEPKHVKAMCQRCHNRVDVDFRQLHRSRTIADRQSEGTLPLFKENK